MELRTIEKVKRDGGRDCNKTNPGETRAYSEEQKDPGPKKIKLFFNRYAPLNSQYPVCRKSIIKVIEISQKQGIQFPISNGFSNGKNKR